MFGYVKDLLWSVYNKIKSFSSVIKSNNVQECNETRTPREVNKCCNDLNVALNRVNSIDSSLILNNIENSCQYAEEELDIRVESLKTQLDVLQEKTCEELDEIMIKFRNSYNKLNKMKINLRKCKIDMIESHLNKLRTETQSKQFKITFLPSIRVITDRQIGETILNELKLKEISCRIKSGKYKVVNIDAKRPFEFCALQNCYFLLADRESHGLIWFDRSYKVIKKIENINGETFQPFGFATNGKNIVYISDWLNNRIIKTNSEFSKVEIFGGTKGNQDDQLNGPWGISYHNDSLYVCDHFNSRIQKLSTDLKLEQSFFLAVLPYNIKISSSYACVMCHHSINFYELSTFKLLNSYVREQNAGSINQIHSKFCEYYDGFMYYYNENGELREKIETGTFGDISLKIGKNGVAYFDGIVVLFSSGLRNKLVLI